MPAVNEDRLLREGESEPASLGVVLEIARDLEGSENSPVAVGSNADSTVDDFENTSLTCASDPYSNHFPFARELHCVVENPMHRLHEHEFVPLDFGVAVGINDDRDLFGDRLLRNQVLSTPHNTIEFDRCE